MKNAPTFGVAAARLACGVVLAATAACQRYQPRPVDVAGHRRAFLARTPETPDVQEMARRLDQAQGPERFDLADGVSLREAEAVSLVFNADLRAARARAGVTLATSQHAGRWEDPVLSVDLARILESVDDPWKVAGVLSFTVPLSGRLHVERQRAGAEHAAELTRVLGREWGTRAELRRAWTEWTSLVRKAEATRSFVEQVDQLLEVVEALERAGEMARSEAGLFRMERATRAAERSMIEAQRDRAEQAVKRLMGLAPRAAVQMLPGSIPEDQDVEAVAVPDRVEAGNANVALARAIYEAAERTLELEVRKQYPDLQIGPGLGSDQGQAEVLLGLSIPIGLFNANRSGIARARAEREAARVELEVALESALADVDAAVSQLQGARAQRALYERDIAPLADAMYADARRLAELGEVNVLVMLESLSRQHEAKLKLIELRREEEHARIQVWETVGPGVASDAGGVP